MAKTLFSPPGNKPKIGLAKPTLAAGQPMPQIQTINRPVNLVDDEGNVHGRLGENPNGPEKVTVTPPPGPTNDPAGGPNYASGGTLLIGGRRGDGGSGTIGYDKEVMPGEGGSDPVYGPPAPNSGQSANWPTTVGGGPPSSGPVYGPPVPVYGPPAPSYNPTATVMGQPQQSRPTIMPGTYPNTDQSVFDAQRAQLAARNSALDYRARVLDAKGGLAPLQQAVYDARGRVIGAQEQQNTLTRGVAQQRQANDRIREQELEAIYGASKNAPDLINTAEARNLYNAEDRRAGQMGVAPEAEVNLPPEYNGPRQAGIRPKIMSQEQRLTEKAGYEDPIRNQQLQQAQDIVALQATDVQAAQLAASKAGLTLDQANELVTKAQLDADYANLISSRRDLETTEAGMEPFPGAVKSSISGNWMTPEERDKERIQYNEGTLQPYQTQVQGQGSQFAALSPAQLLNTIPPKIKEASQAQLYVTPVRAELIRRFRQQGYTDEQAQQAADSLIAQEFATRKGSGGLTEISPTTAPASAPSGSSTGLPPGAPALPPGYN